MPTDVIADMLTRIRNALRARHAKVDVPASRLKVEIARVLKEEGYILNYKVAEEGARKTIKIYLKYHNNRPVITDLKRVSRPGCRIYVGRDRIQPVLGGLGVSILSTPKGVMTDKQARREGVGGELLCVVE